MRPPHSNMCTAQLSANKSIRDKITDKDLDVVRSGEGYRESTTFIFIIVECFVKNEKTRHISLMYQCLLLRCYTLSSAVDHGFLLKASALSRANDGDLRCWIAIGPLHYMVMTSKCMVLGEGL